MSKITKHELAEVTAVFVEFINKLYTKFQIEPPKQSFCPDVEVNRIYTMALRNLSAKDIK